MDADYRLRKYEAEFCVGRFVNFETPQGTTVRIGREDVIRAQVLREVHGAIQDRREQIHAGYRIDQSPGGLLDEILALFAKGGRFYVEDNDPRKG